MSLIMYFKHSNCSLGKIVHLLTSVLVGVSGGTTLKLIILLKQHVPRCFIPDSVNCTASRSFTSLSFFLCLTVLTSDGNKADGGLYVLQKHISPYRELYITFFIRFFKSVDYQ